MSQNDRIHDPNRPYLGNPDFPDLDNDREFHLGMARLHLSEARARRNIPAQRGFTFLLMEWAANARRRAMQIPKAGRQMQLFGEATA